MAEQSIKNCLEEIRRITNLQPAGNLEDANAPANLRKSQRPGGGRIYYVTVKGGADGIGQREVRFTSPPLELTSLVLEGAMNSIKMENSHVVTQNEAGKQAALHHLRTMVTQLHAYFPDMAPKS